MMVPSWNRFRERCSCCKAWVYEGYSMQAWWDWAEEQQRNNPEESQGNEKQRGQHMPVPESEKETTVKPHAKDNADYSGTSYSGYGAAEKEASASSGHHEERKRSRSPAKRSLSRSPASGA